MSRKTNAIYTRLVPETQNCQTFKKLSTDDQMVVGQIDESERIALNVNLFWSYSHFSGNT